MRKLKKPLFTVAILACVTLGWWLFNRQTDGVFKPVSADQDVRLESLRRLNAQQYRHIIRDTFGDMIQLEGNFVGATQRSDGLLEVGASEVGMSAVSLEMAEDLAREVASQVMSEALRDEFLSCVPAEGTVFDRDCALEFIVRVGRLLYRRPLNDEELARLVELAVNTAKSKNSFHAGLQHALVSILVAPDFLFRIENAVADKQGNYQLDAYSRASRLSFLLWNSMPDSDLLDSAGQGELYSTEGLQRQITRMLGSPKMEDGARAFFTDMLAFDHFDRLVKDAALYPGFTYEVSKDAREQTLRTLVDHLLARDADYRDVFTSRHTFLTPVLAAQLSIPMVQNIPNAYADRWQAYEFPEEDPRAGLLAQPAFVALHSHPGRTSPTLRGKALREILLCQEVPPPPPNVDFTLVQDENNPEYRTARQRLSAHSTNPTCAGCHKITDPIGLALESFDGGGRYREQEHGVDIDTTGELDGVSYDDAVGLAVAVRNNPSAVSCLVNRLYSYGRGQALDPSEKKWLKTVREEFAAKGYRYGELLRLLASSPEFYKSRLDPSVALVQGN